MKLEDLVADAVRLLRDGGYFARAAVAKSNAGGPFVLPSEAVITAARGGVARVRVISSAFGQLTPQRLATYVLLSMPWDEVDAEGQYKDFVAGYREVGARVIEL
jgi:hypothetical protein